MIAYKYWKNVPREKKIATWLKVLRGEKAKSQRNQEKTSVSGSCRQIKASDWKKRQGLYYKGC